MKSDVCWPLVPGKSVPLQTWEDERMATILWILAVILVIAGIAAILRGQMLWGIVLIVVGLLVGPGGVSVFT
jgi:TM2 domain-containing membrane protein YozV